MKYLLIILLAASCAPIGTRQLQRAKKLIDKAETNGAVWHRDTVHTSEVIRLPGVRKDSTIVVQLPCGTMDDTFSESVSVEKGKLKATATLHKDKGVKLPTLSIDAEVKPDSIMDRDIVAINNEIVCPDCIQKIKWWWLPVVLVFGIVIGVVVGKFL